ncbi:MAG: hypothetical protein AB7N90_05490, partial [Vicinamibacterales bacterium]
MIALLLAASLATQVSFEAAVAALAAPSAAARLDALAALEASGYPEALAPVAALARDPDDAVQRRALAALLGLARPGRVAGGPARAFDEAVTPAVSVPPGVFDPVAVAMGDASPGVRIDAAYTFAVLAGRPARGVPAPALAAAARALGVMLGDGDAGVRVAAGRAAGHLFRADLAAVPPAGPMPAPLADALVAAMNQPDETEELVAMQALGFAREPRALVALTERYRYHAAEGHRLGAAGALDALAHLARPESVPLFEALLAGGSPLERRLANEGLARMGDPARLPAQAAAAAGARDGQVRLALLYARERLL